MEVAPCDRIPGEGMLGAGLSAARQGCLGSAAMAVRGARQRTPRNNECFLFLLSAVGLCAEIIIEINGLFAQNVRLGMWDSGMWYWEVG